MSPACTMVVCGAPLAARAPEMRAALLAAGWDVGAITTRAAETWLPDANWADDTRPVDRPDVVVVAPITFNTTNKLAGGLADTSVHGYLCETLGAGVPVVAVPTVNNWLCGHPAWDESTRRLARCGVTFLDVHTGQPGLVPVASGTGDAVVRAFDPLWIVNYLMGRVLPSA